jgi:soluble lytic murein transglycosylase-like protein
MKTLLLPIIFLMPTCAEANDAYQRLQKSVWRQEAAKAGVDVSTLYSIAVAESGLRWADGTYRPWPWTLNINDGKGIVKNGARRYSSKVEAQSAVNGFVKSGITNIDIGLMQVNLFWHGDRVKKADELLEPSTNITVAAQYLRELKTANLMRKVGNYHAPTNLSRALGYANRVKTIESQFLDNSYRAVKPKIVVNSAFNAKSHQENTFPKATDFNLNQALILSGLPSQNNL